LAIALAMTASMAGGIAGARSVTFGGGSNKCAEATPAIPPACARKNGVLPVRR
jgi:hypothetical protein